MKIWQCYSGLAAQTFYYTDDNRVAVEGKGQCLDLPSGSLTNGNVIQTWGCSTGNNNQVWKTSASTVAARRDVEERQICAVSSGWRPVVCHIPRLTRKGRFPDPRWQEGGARGRQRLQ